MFASLLRILSQRAESGQLRQAGFLETEFIFVSAPFSQCHASTIAETERGLVAAWFGGTRERHPDVGIWLARNEGSTWTPPVEVANGVQADGERFPCWNPVLFQPEDGPLLLFFKVGPRPKSWWGMMVTSEDCGRTWSPHARLPEGILGPIKNKPVQLPGGEILCGSSTEHDGWRVHFERTADYGFTWEKTEPVSDGKGVSAIQPAILAHRGGCLQALCRTKQGRVYQTWSADGGGTWSELSATALPNPNSGLDALTLADGRHLLVYNHTIRGRSPLNVAVSSDGLDWQAPKVLERGIGEFSYPAVIQTQDGMVHVTYTWKRRRIRHVVLDPEKF